MRRPLIAALAGLFLAVPAAHASAPEPLPARSQLLAQQKVYLAAAEAGVAAISHWYGNTGAAWYDDFVNPAPHMPLARLWSAYPLFESLVAIAKADPTPANVKALRTFADRAATLYWNPQLKPVGGYEWYPGLVGPNRSAYFDDSGWWGLSFIDAYRVTGDRAYLGDAARAFSFIVFDGWNPHGGGVWWNTGHSHITAEPLAAAILIGTWLYKVEHRRVYLNWVNKLLAWANAHSFNESAGLYQRNATDGTVMDYVEGLMIDATWQLCKLEHEPSLCWKARKLANHALAAFPANLDWAPQYDVVYLRWMLDYYELSGDARWYALAYQNAQRVLPTKDWRGLYVTDWNGKWLSDGLEEAAANVEVLAVLAAAPVPPG